MKVTVEKILSRCCPEPNTGCWLWTGAPRGFGYGRVRMGKGKPSLSAHRASWIAHRGPIPPGKAVLHKCDVPSCVNPDHLFLGTQLDNMRDRQKKGHYASGAQHHARRLPHRVARGSNHGNAKLSEQDVRKMRELSRAGVRGLVLAKKYGLTYRNVRHILTGQSWAHVEGGASCA